MRSLLLVGAILAGTALSSPVRADEPMPSGTILSGSGETPASPEVDYGCAGAVDCRAWLESGCSRDLSGQDPAPQASIVDVGQFADGVSQRTIVFPEGITPSGDLVRVQFWDSGCAEVAKSRWNSVWCRQSPCSPRPFRIPVSAQWMTVSSRPDNLTVEWELT